MRDKYGSRLAGDFFSVLGVWFIVGKIMIYGCSEHGSCLAKTCFLYIMSMFSDCKCNDLRMLGACFQLLMSILLVLGPLLLLSMHMASVTQDD